MWKEIVQKEGMRIMETTNLFNHDTQVTIYFKPLERKNI